MTAAEIGHALQGKPSNRGFLCRCPVPGHGQGRGDWHPSLWITDGAERLLVKCFAGCDSRDVIAALRQTGFIEQPASTIRPRIFIECHSITHEPDRKALALWTSAMPALGTAVELHLRRFRGITIEIPDTIRCGRGPSMVAAVQRLDGQVVAVQTTHLMS